MADVARLLFIDPAMRLLFVLLSTLLSVAVVGAQDKPEPPTFECRWATGPIQIDGKGDDPAWQSAQLIDKFGLPWLKENARPAKTTTKARLLWDRENLYFIAELEDHDLFSDIVEHDGRTWLNDVFELFFRPDDSKPPYYEFQVNAGGTMLDIYFQRKGVPFDDAKKDGEFHWQSAVVRRGTLDNRSDRDEGWSVEGRIPWSDFQRTGGRPAEGDAWRFALCRYDYTLNERPETSTCAPLGQPSFHLLEDYARLKFVGMKAGLNRPGLPDRARVATSRVIGSPDPPLPYRPVRAFPNLKLTFPIALDHIPGSDQLLVIAQEKSYGPATILRITYHPNASQVEQALVIPGGGTAYVVCFHPRFAENGYVYVGWNGALEGAPKRTFATRYTMDR